MSTSPLSLVDSVAEVCAQVPDSATVQHLSDDALLVAASAVAGAQQRLDTRAGWIAAEIARRSGRELGYAGLAQRQGFRTAEALVQHVTGTNRSEATKLVRVGTMVAEAESSAIAAAIIESATAESGGVDADARAAAVPVLAETRPWLTPVSRAVAAETMSFAQAEAIRSGLGECDDPVLAGRLLDAAVALVAAATDSVRPSTADELRRVARQLRDSLDADGLAAREDLQRDAQYVRAWRRSDGMVGSAVLLDPENGAYFLSVIDELTSPRRGGPRFVDAKTRERAGSLIDDPRSTERIAAEGVMQLLRIGVSADPGTVRIMRKAAVRIVVSRDALAGDSTEGRHGVIEDTGEPVSLATVERQACADGMVEVTVDRLGRPLDVGREQRLFTARQKIALAVRDGGCLMPDCDRPPSWTEAHHIDHYAEHHGLTNTEDGVLLCRHHHLLMHNNGWRIIRHGSDYFARPPASEDPDQELRPLHSKSPLTRATSLLRGQTSADGPTRTNQLSRGR